jgi:hypothetical protein
MRLNYGALRVSVSCISILLHCPAVSFPPIYLFHLLSPDTVTQSWDFIQIYNRKSIITNQTALVLDHGCPRPFLMSSRCDASFYESYWSISHLRRLRVQLTSFSDCIALKTVSSFASAMSMA